MNQVDATITSVDPSVYASALSYFGSHFVVWGSLAVGLFVGSVIVVSFFMGYKSGRG